MVSLADSVSHRARFVWVGVALASAIAVFVATRPAASMPHRAVAIGRCVERVHLPSTTTPKQDQIHVYTGLMVGRMGDEPYLHLMESLVTTALARQSAWIVESTLTAGDASGLTVSGTLDTLAVEPERDYSYVRCKVSMMLAAYPQHEVLAHTSGNASVKASSNKPEDLALASQACVTAVVDDISTKLIPAIEAARR